MAALLKPIKVKRVSDQAYEQIRDLIFRGQLKPGEQIMPERDLAQALGVSRPTVREAIKQLVTMGLLEHRQGQGTYVRSISDQRELNPLGRHDRRPQPHPGGTPGGADGPGRPGGDSGGPAGHA